MGDLANMNLRARLQTLTRETMEIEDKLGRLVFGKFCEYGRFGNLKKMEVSECGS